MLEAREYQPEVIKPMRQRDANNRDAKRARVGEVGQAKTAGRVLLPEDDCPVLGRPAPANPACAAPACA
jgi:hypothetical protein